MKREQIIRVVSDDDVEIPDGRSLRVPMMMFDSRRFAYDAPGYQDARKAARLARDEWVARLQDAWKHPPTRDGGQPDSSSAPQELRRYLRGNEPDDDGAPRRRLSERPQDAEWRRYRDNLQNAWRGPIGRTNPNAATSEGSAVERRAAAVEEDRRDFTHEQWRERR
jgi:hypothetical protein